MKNLLSILPEEFEQLKFQEEFPKLLAIYFIKENGVLKFNPFKSPLPVSFSEETVNKNGKDYLLLIYDLKENLIEEIYFSPGSESNYDILVIPYYLNIGKLELINLKNNTKETEDLSPLAICNENNICESGEENLCLLDCKTAENKYYPLTHPAEKFVPPELTTETAVKREQEPIPLPSTVFSNLFLITLIFIGIFALIIFAIYFIKKRK